MGINDNAGSQHPISEHVTGVVTALHDGNMSHNVTMIRDNISIFSMFSFQFTASQAAVCDG